LHLHAPRDLETICMKCLAKEPARRYASALELAEDLGRFRAGEPIKARPVSVAERVVRWSRRNPKVAGLLAALAFVTAVGFISVSALWLHAETQRGRAESNWNRAETQRGRAENNLKGALGAVDTYFTKTSENRLLNEPGAEGLRRDLLLAARDYYVRFVNENEQEAELQADLGKSLYRLGQILGDVESPAEGIKHHERARAIFKELVKDQPKEPAHPASSRPAAAGGEPDRCLEEALRGGAGTLGATGPRTSRGRPLQGRDGTHANGPGQSAPVSRQAQGSRGALPQGPGTVAATGRGGTEE
jgi:hypothetical protein